MVDKLNVAVLFGGRSCEHEVSVQSASGIMDAMDRERFNVIPLGVTKDGEWILMPEGQDQRPDVVTAQGGRRVALIPQPCGGRLMALDGPGGAELPRLDAVLPIIHGPMGEDGTVQGLFELAEVPYVGSGVLGSAVSMDKRVMKTLLRSRGLPVGDFVAVSREQWRDDPGAVREICERALPYPWFVKPANMGSSVGVSRVSNTNELAGALDIAAQYDHCVLVEAGITSAREIEVSVLGNEDPKASVPGEILPSNEFYDYRAKYIDGTSGLVIPAELPEAVSERIRAMAVEAFKALDCEGLARVDFLYRETTDEAFVLEANTLPGFTPISMYPKLWEATGLSYRDLITELLDLAIQRRARRAQSKTGIEIHSLE